MSHTAATEVLAQIVQERTKDVSLMELERKTGISRATLRRKRTTGEFTLTELVRLANYLGTTPSALMAEAEAAA